MAGVGYSGANAGCPRKLKMQDSEAKAETSQLSSVAESLAERAEYDHHENQILSDNKAMSHAVTRLWPQAENLSAETEKVSAQLWTSLVTWCNLIWKAYKSLYFLNMFFIIFSSLLENLIDHMTFV